MPLSDRKHIVHTERQTRAGFFPSPSRPLCPFTYAYRHTGERGTFFLQRSFSFSNVHRRGEWRTPTKIIRRLCVLSVRGKSFSLAFKSLLPLSSPSGLLSPDSWAASHSGHSGWMEATCFYLSLSLTSSICCTCRPSSFLLSLPSTCRSTFHSFFVSSLSLLFEKSLWEEKKNRSREPLFLRNHQSSLSPPLPAHFFRQVTGKKKRDEKHTRTSIWITLRNGSRMLLVSLTILYIYVVSFPHFYVFFCQWSISHTPPKNHCTCHNSLTHTSATRSLENLTMLVHNNKHIHIPDCLPYTVNNRLSLTTPCSFFAQCKR